MSLFNTVDLRTDDFVFADRLLNKFRTDASIGYLGDRAMGEQSPPEIDRYSFTISEFLQTLGFY